MLPLNILRQKDRPLKILCLGAHSDDIEIGCGGTLIKLIEHFPDSEFLWVVLSASGDRAREAEKSAQAYLDNIKTKEIIVTDFRDTFFPYIGKEIKEFFGTFRPRMNPDIIFTANRFDLHQDHRIVSELTLNAYRNNLIFEYEIVKYDGDLGTPNTYVTLDKTVCLEKIRRIKKFFPTQSEKSWFDDENFLALMRIRGVEINSPTKYAEGFYCRKSSMAFSLT